MSEARRRNETALGAKLREWEQRMAKSEATVQRLENEVAQLKSQVGRMVSEAATAMINGRGTGATT